MTAPTPPQESQNLQRLVEALAFAQSIQTVRQALEVFPDVAEEAIEALLSIGQVRNLIRIHPLVTEPEPIQAMYRHNLMRRAAYLVSAARRLTTAYKGPANGRVNRLQDAVTREKDYLSQHLTATLKRANAARRVSEQAQLQQAREDRRTGVDALVSGPTGLLGWYAVIDEKTSPECRRANRRNFNPRRIPKIGYPGAVHPHCRCKAGPPHPTHLRVEELEPDQKAKAAPVADSGWQVRSAIV